MRQILPHKQVQRFQIARSRQQSVKKVLITILSLSTLIGYGIAKSHHQTNDNSILQETISH
jgi:hypothetical protein